jgi:exosortase
MTVSSPNHQTDLGGGLVDLVRAAPVLPAPNVNRRAIIIAAALAALLLGVHYSHLTLMVQRWMHDVNWAHGFLIPLFSIFLIYARWPELSAARRRVCLWGLPVMLVGIAAEVLSHLMLRVPWAVQLSSTIVAFGVVLYLAGPSVARIAWLPIFYLAFAMPMPERLYQDIALPLQNFAAKVSGIILHAFGVHLTVTASNMDIITISGQVKELTVAEACSGVRSLMAFGALAVAMAFVTNRPVWYRVIVALAAVPVAIACNVLRVTATCTMFVVDKPELGSDFMHEFMGLAMLVPAFVLLWLLGKVLDWMVSDVEEEPAPEPAVSGAEPSQDTDT